MRRQPLPAPANSEFFTWSEYLKPELIAEFEKENNVKVKTDYFGNNEELLAKIQVSVQSGGEGYDLILPSDYMVGNMVALGLLQPLDKTKLGFLSAFANEFTKPAYDPELKFAVPFAWGTTGIAVNTKLAPKLDLSKGLSWKDIFETSEFKGKVTMLDDAKENLHAALLVLGKSWDKANEADIKEAFVYLKAHKKSLRIFTSETRPVVESDECVLCQIYSGDALSIASKKPEIKFVIPREGATIWTDNFAIPKNAKNLDMAYAFLNKMLSAKGAVAFTQKTFYPTPNSDSWKLLPVEMQSNPSVFPPKDVFSKLRYLSEKADLLPVIDRQWTELKTE